MTWLVDGHTFAKKVKNPTGHSNNNGGDSRSRVIYCPSCGSIVPKNHTGQEWPGLPAGVKFDPSDQELLEHLAAKRGLASAKPHAFIDEFIPTLDGEDGICYTHPENLPGIKFDGGSTHFFHRPSRAYTTGTRKRRRIQSESDDGQFGVEMRWHKTGKTRPVVENGKQLGFKKIMVLYISMGKKNKPEKTNWVMHQYHLGTEEEEKEGELLVSKVFYQTQPRNSSSTHRVDELEEIETAGAALPLSSCDAMTSSNLQGTPVTPIPASTRMEPVHEDTEPRTASNSRNPPVDVSDKMAEVDLSEGVITNRDTCSVLRWKNVCLEQNEQPDVILQPMHELEKDQQIPHLQVESQILLEDLDIDVMNLLCDECLQADGTSMHDSSQSFFCIAADFGFTLSEVLEEAEMPKNDAVLDNILLDTPPEFLLDSLMNSQDTMDWLGKKKFCISSQISAGGDEFNCIEPPYNSQ